MLSRKSSLCHQTNLTFPLLFSSSKLNFEMCFSYPQCEEHNRNLTCIFETLVRTGASTQPELGEMGDFIIVYVFLSGFNCLLKDRACLTYLFVKYLTQ